MAAISESFYKSLLTLASVFTVGYLVNSNLTSTIENVNKPLVEKVISLEKRQDILENKQTDIVESIDVLSEQNKINTLCLNNSISFINKQFNKEFLKPEELSITKRKK